VGLFDASRTGDDVSGREWERTRRTGVNTLAFRLPQHRTFFMLDPDCIPLTPELPWSMSRQWLQAVANSGTVLLISADSRAVGKDQLDAMRAAFELYAHKPGSEPMNSPVNWPLDWLDSRTPSAWSSAAGTETYNWILEGGETPFPIGIPRGPA
jgi:alpha-galactosidase